ncbi:alpha/beta fold hydrolase [Actinomadura macra]|uniref:alpha/beta fold hydrolase n=1 Tax=Actinomadura macra TaxID=46164 RepID=UPI000B190716|nr:alpha/beta hydrolase [Actinomadura macra]
MSGYRHSSRDLWPWPTSTIATPAGPVSVTDSQGTGPTIVLVHVGLGSLLWRDLIAELAPRFRCVTLDAPGTGRTPAPTTGISLTTAADAVSAVLRTLDLRHVTLAVHDLGGPAGIAAAAREPDRIAAIAAINTFGWRPTGTAFRAMLAIMGSGPVRESDAWTGWLPWLTSTRFGVGRHQTRAERRSFRDAVDRDGRRAFHRYMADARRNDRLFQHTEAALKGLLADRPLLTVFGQRNDPLKLQPEWKALFPDAVQHTIPGGYHFPMCDAPAQVADHLRTWHSAHVTQT